MGSATRHTLRRKTASIMKIRPSFLNIFLTLDPKNVGSGLEFDLSLKNNLVRTETMNIQEQKIILVILLWALTLEHNVKDWASIIALQYCLSRLPTVTIFIANLLKEQVLFNYAIEVFNPNHK